MADAKERKRINENYRARLVECADQLVDMLLRLPLSTEGDYHKGLDILVEDMHQQLRTALRSQSQNDPVVAARHKVRMEAMKKKITIGNCLHCVLREAIQVYADVRGDEFSMGEAIHSLSSVIGEHIAIASSQSGYGADGIRATAINGIDEVLASHKDKTIPPGTTHH